MRPQFDRILKKHFKDYIPYGSTDSVTYWGQKIPLTYFLNAFDEFVERYINNNDNSTNYRIIGNKVVNHKCNHKPYLDQCDVRCELCDVEIELPEYTILRLHCNEKYEFKQVPLILKAKRYE